MRLLGVDSATAARIVWLARMAAVRDAALGGGVLAAMLARRAEAPALLASAAVDAADAALIAVAAREGRVDALRGYLVAGAAVVAVAAGVAAAAGAGRQRRVSEALDALANARVDDRADAWR